jgi:hypothetical protein
MYSRIPIHWNIKSAPAGPGRSRAGSALYVFSLLGVTSTYFFRIRDADRSLCWIRFTATLFLNTIVSLPREWFQEIKRMMVMHSTHGLFLSCTHNLIYIYITYNQSLIKTPCQGKKEQENPNLLAWCESPSTLVPCLLATAPPLDAEPLSPLSHPFSPITLFTTTTSTIKVFFVRENYV